MSPIFARRRRVTPACKATYTYGVFAQGYVWSLCDDRLTSQLALDCIRNTWVREHGSRLTGAARRQPGTFMNSRTDISTAAGLARSALFIPCFCRLQNLFDSNPGLLRPDIVLTLPCAWRSFSRGLSTASTSLRRLISAIDCTGCCKNLPFMPVFPGAYQQ